MPLRIPKIICLHCKKEIPGRFFVHARKLDRNKEKANEHRDANIRAQQLDLEIEVQCDCGVVPVTDHILHFKGTGCRIVSEE